MLESGQHDVLRLPIFSSEPESDLAETEFNGWFDEPFLGLLKRQPNLFVTIKRMAKQLESLHEYNPKQALFVAADIVRCRFSHLMDSTTKEI